MVVEGVGVVVVVVVGGTVVVVVVEGVVVGVVVVGLAVVGGVVVVGRRVVVVGRRVVVVAAGLVVLVVVATVVDVEPVVVVVPVLGIPTANQPSGGVCTGGNHVTGGPDVVVARSAASVVLVPAGCASVTGLVEESSPPMIPKARAPKKPITSTAVMTGSMIHQRDSRGDEPRPLLEVPAPPELRDPPELLAPPEPTSAPLRRDERLVAGAASVAECTTGPRADRRVGSRGSVSEASGSAPSGISPADFETPAPGTAAVETSGTESFAAALSVTDSLRNPGMDAASKLDAKVSGGVGRA